MVRKVALVGYGAIAREICKTLIGDPDISVVQVLTRPERVEETQRDLPTNIRAISSLDDLSPEIGFVLETAGHGAVRDFAAICLARGIDFGLVSAGALASRNIQEALIDAAHRGQARLVVVPGAIGGIDALSAAGAALDEVVYTACKPALSWAGSPAEAAYNLKSLSEPTAVFQGTAREAALAFPKNANVVATVALAGIGFDPTRVTLLADPRAMSNSHHIRATGPQFDLDYRTSGAALPTNPKTSALTAYSAVRTLRHLGHGIVV